MIGISSSVCSFSSLPILKPNRCYSSSNFSSRSPNPRLFPIPNQRRSFGRGAVQCNSSGTHGPGSSENESKDVLDAFFLGKAFAEALNERIGSAVGEILSVVGQWQAEQQKQAQDFQEEVVERAKRAKEKAALEVSHEQNVPSESLITAQDAVISVTPPSPSLGPTMEDPLRAMFMD